MSISPRNGSLNVALRKMLGNPRGDAIEGGCAVPLSLRGVLFWRRLTVCPLRVYAYTIPCSTCTRRDRGSCSSFFSSQLTYTLMETNLPLFPTRAQLFTRSQLLRSAAFAYDRLRNLFSYRAAIGSAWNLTEKTGA